MGVRALIAVSEPEEHTVYAMVPLIDNAPTESQHGKCGNAEQGANVTLYVGSSVCMYKVYCAVCTVRNVQYAQ